jgi:hypothetical protein
MMDKVHLFTQDEKYLSFRNRRFFLAAGLLPVLSVSLAMTWLSGPAGVVLGVSPGHVVMAIPLLLAAQFLVIAAKWRQRGRTILRLTAEQLILVAGTVEQVFDLSKLNRVTVRRDGERQVLRLVLWFGRERLRLEGFLGMDTLRDLLVRHAGADRKDALQVRDVPAK